MPRVVKCHESSRGKATARHVETKLSTVTFGALSTRTARGDTRGDACKSEVIIERYRMYVSYREIIFDARFNFSQNIWDCDYYIIDSCCGDYASLPYTTYIFYMLFWGHRAFYIRCTVQLNSNLTLVSDYSRLFSFISSYWSIFACFLRAALVVSRILLRRDTYV